MVLKICVHVSPFCVFTQVTLLFPLFYEHASPQRVQDGDAEPQLILRDIHDYNRRFSGQPRSVSTGRPVTKGNLQQSEEVHCLQRLKSESEFKRKNIHSEVKIPRGKMNQHSVGKRRNKNLKSRVHWKTSAVSVKMNQRKKKSWIRERKKVESEAQIWTCFVCFTHLLSLLLSPPVDGPAARCSNAAASRLQGDVLHGWPVLDVSDPDPAVPGGCAGLPGVTSGHPSWGSLWPAGLHGRLLCDPAAPHLHLHHVQGGGDTKTQRLDGGTSWQ